MQRALRIFDLIRAEHRCKYRLIVCQYYPVTIIDIPTTRRRRYQFDTVVIGLCCVLIMSVDLQIPITCYQTAQTNQYYNPKDDNTIGKGTVDLFGIGSYRFIHRRSEPKRSVSQ